MPAVRLRAMTSSAPQRAHGRAWRAHVARLMPELRARADDHCELCGGEVDFSAPARSSRSASVDHVVPIHAGGDELPPVDELRLVHYGCNARRGNRTRRLGTRRPVAPAVELQPTAEPRAVTYELPPRRRRERELIPSQPSLLDDLELKETTSSSRFLRTTA